MSLNCSDPELNKRGASSAWSLAERLIHSKTYEDTFWPRLGLALGCQCLVLMDWPNSIENAAMERFAESLYDVVDNLYDCAPISAKPMSVPERQRFARLLEGLVPSLPDQARREIPILLILLHEAPTWKKAIADVVMASLDQLASFPELVLGTTISFSVSAQTSIPGIPSVKPWGEVLSAKQREEPLPVKPRSEFLPKKDPLPVKPSSEPQSDQPLGLNRSMEAIFLDLASSLAKIASGVGGREEAAPNPPPVPPRPCCLPFNAKLLPKLKAVVALKPDEVSEEAWRKNETFSVLRKACPLWWRLAPWAASVVAVAMLTWVIDLGLRPTTAEAAAKSQPPSSAPLPGHYTSFPEDRVRLEQTLAAFHQATTPEAKCRLVRGGENMLPLLQDYYRGHAPEAPLAYVTTEIFPFEEKGRLFYVGMSRLKDTTHTPFVVERVGEQFLIDWRASKGEGDLPYAKFMAEKPQKPVRMRVTGQIDDFMAGIYHDASQWVCLRLVDAADTITLYGYAPAEEPVGTSLINLFRGKSQKSAELTLDLVWDVPSESTDQVRIVRLANTSWVDNSPTARTPQRQP